MFALISAVRTLGLSAALMTKEVMDLAVAFALVSVPPGPDVGGMELLWQPTKRTKFNANNKVNGLFISEDKDSQNSLPPYRITGNSICVGYFASQFGYTSISFTTQSASVPVVDAHRCAMIDPVTVKSDVKESRVKLTTSGREYANR
jgi:hypothetical protein